MGILTTKINPFNQKLTPKQKYELSEEYYNNNYLYENLTAYAADNNKWLESMKPLKNPVHRSVEFFVAKLLPGNDTGITAISEQVKAAIEQFQKWSNFDSQKNVISRQLSMYGDLFIRVTAEGGKVFSETINPKYVVDFNTDQRGFLQEIRIDIPSVDSEGKKFNHIEYWNKEYFSIWQDYKLGENTPLDQLGDPFEFGFLTELGIDFIPIVYIQFSSVGEKRGKSCFEHAIQKINELNRITTDLHKTVFRYSKGIWVKKTNQVDEKTGKPRFGSLTTSNNAELILKENSIISLDGLESLESLIPNIQYDSIRNIVLDQLTEIEKDLPEIKYFDLSDSISGKALRLALSSAADRAIEAQGNLLAGLKRINEIALTIGKNLGIFPSTIGSYESGDFEHKILVDPMFPLDMDELATALSQFTTAGLALATSLRLLGKDDMFIETALKEKLEEQSKQDNGLANAIMGNFNSQ